METTKDGNGDGGTPRRRRRLLVAVGIALVLIAAGLFFAFGGERPTSRSSDEVVDAYRRTSINDATSTPAGTSPPPSGVLHAPAAGVYLYRGNGTEKTSLPPLTEQQGPDLPATVTPTSTGCWTIRLDYNTHHWQTWNYCPDSDGRGLHDTGGTSFSRREMGTIKIDNTSTFVCDPPAAMVWTSMSEADARRATCTGTSELLAGDTTSSGTTTFVGDEPITVGGSPIGTHHLRIDRTLAGAQTGTEHIDLWLATDTGLPIRNDRTITVDTATPIGSVHYVETGHYELTSLTPRT